MSTQSPQATAAGETAAWQSQLAGLLSGIAVPELQKLLGQPTIPGHYDTVRTDEGTQRVWVPPTGGTTGSLTDLLSSTQGGTQKSSLDLSVLSGAKGELNRGYDRAGTTSAESIGYQALRSGEGRRSAGATSSAIRGAATSLERDRQGALNNLEFQSSMSSLADYNSLLGLVGQGASTSLGLASGFGSASGSAIGGMSNTSPFGSALGGAASGAAMGSTINVPYGTIAGGLIGGIGGYFAGGH